MRASASVFVRLWKNLSGDRHIRLLSASTSWHPQWCLCLVTVYGVDPQVGQSLDGLSLSLCSTICLWISSHGYFDSHSKNALQELGNFIRSYLFILELTELAISVLFRKFPVYFGLEVLYILNLHRQFCHTLLWYLLYLRFSLFSLIYFVGDVYICNSWSVS